MKHKIYLQKIGDLDHSILLKLKKDLEWSFKEYKLKVKILSDIIPLDDSEYDETRKQYNASLLINKLINHINNKRYFRTLGVLDEDIYSAFLNFVFGVAIIPKKKFQNKSIVALISITRLREQFYGKSNDDAMFELRILKEAVHELGHTFGLKHCDNHCIMRFSNRLSHTDDKPPKFCKPCEIKLKGFFKGLE